MPIRWRAANASAWACPPRGWIRASSTRSTLQELPPGEVGELVTRGEQVMSGYWRNAQADAAAFIELDGQRLPKSGTGKILWRELQAAEQVSVPSSNTTSSTSDPSTEESGS